MTPSSASSVARRDQKQAQAVLRTVRKFLADARSAKATGKLHAICILIRASWWDVERETV